MNEQYILKEVAEVAVIAKRIFGDIVKNVYYAELSYDFVVESDTIASIDKLINTASNQENSIDQDARTIVIEFINGHHVIFSNSEWCCMESFHSSSIKKIV